MRDSVARAPTRNLVLCVLGCEDAWLRGGTRRTMTGMDLTNRTAVITGASSGIGAATARALAAAGAHVTLVARRADRISQLASELGGEAVTADVADRAALDAIGREFDLVVANAGVMLPSPAEVSDGGDLERMLDANVLGLVNHVRGFAPGQLAGGH